MLTTGGKSIAIDNFERFQGTNGVDTFTLTGSEKEVDGKGGRDTADFGQASSSVKVGDGGVKLIDVEVIKGSALGDNIRVDQTIDGAGGADQLAGGAGFDTHYVTAGDIVRDSDGKGKLFQDRYPPGV